MFKKLRRILACITLFILFLTFFSFNRVSADTAYNISIYSSSTMTASGTFKGFGVQEDANLLWTGPNRAQGSVPLEDYKTYIAPRLKRMKLPWIRKFVDLGWFAYNQGTYDWNSNAMIGLYTDLQELQSDGTTVILTIWRIPPWLTGTSTIYDTELRTAGSFPTAGSSPNYDDRWSTVVTDLLKHLYGTDGSGYSFTNIKYVCGPNELETENNVSRLDNPYNLLQTKITNAGLGSSISLFGPDASYCGAIISAKNDSSLNSLLAFYDYHFYSSSTLI